ncbi:MAG: hypothetical protein R3E14_15240, partial [Erythrobacter sp.]
GVWLTKLPDWQKGRAVGRLLEQLVRSRPNDWKAVLHVLDAELAKHVRLGDQLACRARTYLSDWITGHFYDLAEIRSIERIKAAIISKRTNKLARKAERKKTRR